MDKFQLHSSHAVRAEPGVPASFKTTNNKAGAAEYFLSTTGVDGVYATHFIHDAQGGSDDSFAPNNIQSASMPGNTYCLDGVSDDATIGQLFDYKNHLHVEMSFVPFV